MSGKGPRQLKQEKQAILVALFFCVGIGLAIALLLAAGRLVAGRQAPVQGLATLSATSASGGAPQESAVVRAVAKVAPSVVTIDVYDSGGFAPTGSGSGVVLTADGYIATNAHVVFEAPNVRVVLHDGRGFTADIVGLDTRADLALLKIDAQGLTPAEMGDSSAVVVGQWAVTMGNATGSLPGTPSQGIISGVGRSMPLGTATGDVVRMNLLQTDAAINPGSSGGALADIDGRVIGICIGKIEDANVENVGFAIPMGDALPILNALMEEDKRQPTPMLGVVTEELNETNTQAATAALPQKGLYISDLTAQSGLLAQGVQPGDVLLEADGKPMQTTEDLVAVLGGHQVGDTITVKVYSAADKEERELEVELYAQG